jgi:hypothetical protein
MYVVFSEEVLQQSALSVNKQEFGLKMCFCSLSRMLLCLDVYSCTGHISVSKFATRSDYSHSVILTT